MQINVSQLLRDPVGSTRQYDVDGIAEIFDNGERCWVYGDVRLMRIQRSILVRCSVDTEVELTCSRCLSTFRQPLALDFEEEYLPSIDIVSGELLPQPEEAGAFTIDEHHILDLTEAISQYILMAIPMKPLCHQDCAGLCPDCGHDLNQGSCSCSNESTNPRWAELKKLRNHKVK